MLTTYKVDMAMALEHMARSQGMLTSYDDTSEEARVKRAKTAVKTHTKRRLEEEEEDDGPPDKHQHFQKENKVGYVALRYYSLEYGVVYSIANIHMCSIVLPYY